MSRFTRCVLCSRALVVWLLSVASAGAARVQVAGGPRITAIGTDTAGSRIVNHTASQTIACHAEQAEGALRPHTAAASYPVAIGHRMSLSFSSCVLAPSTGVTVDCAFTKWTVTGATVGLLTPGAFPAIACDIRLGTGLSSTCHVTTANAFAGGSSIALSMSNATRQLTVDQAHTRVGLTGRPAGCVLRNSTSVRFQGSSGGNLVYNIFPPFGITITAT
jgi:hypothetical protein